LLYSTSRNNKNSETVFWKEVEEGWVRYDQSTGSTQLVSSLARFVIDLIDDSPTPLSFQDIADQVLRAEPDAEQGDCRVEVKAVLRILSDAQLILSVQP
jgi:hypothetical protein